MSKYRMGIPLQEYYQIYYEYHKEDRNLHSKLWIINNRDKARYFVNDWRKRKIEEDVDEYHKARNKTMILWRKNNPDKVKAQSKRYYIKHREKILKKQKERRENSV